MVQWICSNDGTQVLCACEYSDVHSNLFQHIKGAALGLLKVEGSLADWFTTLAARGEAELWPARLNHLLRNEGGGFCSFPDRHCARLCCPWHWNK